MIEYLFVIEIMLLLLVSEILLVAADLYGGDVGLGVDCISVFRGADIFIKHVERYTHTVFIGFFVFSESVLYTNKIVAVKAYFFLFRHT